MRVGSPVLEPRRGEDGLHQSQRPRAARRWLLVDNVSPPFQGEKRVVFLVILAVARMVIWQT